MAPLGMWMTPGRISRSRKYRPSQKAIQITREDSKNNRVAFLDCVVIIETDKKLDIEVHRKPIHTDQYLLFDSHHPLQHKLGMIVPTTTEATNMEQRHLKTTLTYLTYTPPQPLLYLMSLFKSGVRRS